MDAVQTYTAESGSRRAGALGATLAIHVAFAAIILAALGPGEIVRTASQSLAAINVTVPETAPPPEPPTIVAEKPRGDEGQSSPENIKSKATAVVAKPSPAKSQNKITASDKANKGNQTQSGASDKAGPGSGAGGQGDGFGSGNSGDGDGGGGTGMIVSEAQKIAGQINAKDYRGVISKDNPRVEVGVSYTVLPSGRASSCRVRKSSGKPDLDALTCQLVEQRWRYRPATNDRGQAVPTNKLWVQIWYRK